MDKVNIIIGRFQPMTKGHMKCIEFAYNNRGLPTVICMIDTPENKVDEKHPFPSSLSMPLYKNIFKGNKMVKDIVLVKNADIVKIGQALGEYKIASWTCGTDRYDSYKKMSDKYHDQAGLSDDFELIEIKRSDEDISATKLRIALKMGDRKEFFKLFVPVPLSAHLKEDPYEVLKAQIDKVK